MPRNKFYITHEDKKKNSISTKLWKSALYIRLSREDGDKAESDSVTNQKKLLTHYIKEHEEFMFSEVYIDEDFTGTNFKRPAFLRMIKDIEKGIINNVIVKDLSRFGRDYIGAGKYLEHIFPKYNCRFISILDDLDSYVNPDEITGLMVRIKSLIHDQNSQDISKKVRATKDMLRKEGKYIGGHAPYGYIRDPDDRHRLIIDEKAAIIVQNIFNWHLSGMGVVRIAQKLSCLGITTCSRYKKTGNVYEESMINGKGWPPRTVREILSNKTYIGALDQKRSTTRNYKDRKIIYLNEQDHIIVNDTHEPIITKEKFDLVQHEFKSRCTMTARDKERLHPLSGFIRCGECNFAMVRNQTFQKGRWYVYYKCKAFNQRGEKVCKHSKSIREEKLYDTILTIINMQIQSLVNSKKLIEKINKKSSKSPQFINYHRIIEKKQKSIDKYKGLKLNCYIDWKNNSLSKEEYVYTKEKFDNHISELTNTISKLKKEYEAENNIRNNKLKWLDNIIKYGVLTELTREIMINLVEIIHITCGNQIKITFKYSDEFSRLGDFIANNCNAINKQRDAHVN